LTTTDLDNGCRDDFGGTSGSAPIVAGAVALILEANSNLTYRDVMHVIVNSSFKNDPNNADWYNSRGVKLIFTRSVNSAGFNHSYLYGFGRIDATAAVNLASTWTLVGPLSTYSVSQVTKMTQQ
jgi:subtilisin family serine protease